MNNPNKYYVYAHQRLDDDSIFYIGKGTGKRAWGKTSRNKHWKSITNKADYRVLILQDGMSETDAFTLERFLIAFYGRADLDEGRLANHTDGGEGTSNLTASGKQKIAESNKINKQRLGIPFTDEAKQLISSKRKLQVITEEHKQKTSKTMKGKKKPEGFGEKLSKTRQGAKWCTNGITNKIFKNNEMPEGFTFGFSRKK